MLTVISSFNLLICYFSQILLLHPWVIIDLETVLEDVLGFIFAPDEFFTEDLSECKIKGLLPWSRLESLFPFKANIVATILTELRLGVLLPDNSAIQIPGLLRDIHMKSSVLENNEEYAQYAGFRFALKLKTDIFSHSSFPKLQVTMLQKLGKKVQLWTHGLCCIINEVQVVIYMDEEKQSIDIVLRSKTLNEKGCYLVREEIRRIVKDELRDSSAGSEYIEQLLRPADLRNRSRKFQAYDLQEVLDHHIQKKMSITLDGLQMDSVQELLFCNYLEIDGKYVIFFDEYDIILLKLYICVYHYHNMRKVYIGSFIVNLVCITV